MFNKLNNRMNSNMDSNIYLGVIVLLAAAIFVLQRTWLSGAIAFVVIVAAVYFSRKNSESKELFFSSYMDNIVRNIERANHFAITNLDVGMAVFSKNGKLQWKNDTFSKFVGKTKLEGMAPNEILPLPTNMTFELMCVKDTQLLLQINDRYYDMRCAKVETQERTSKNEENTASGLIVYLKDITELQQLKEKYSDERICLAYMRMDSYEDVMRGLTETETATLNGEINTLISKWVAEYGGFICRMNKEMCLLGFTRASMEKIEGTEFDILKKIRQVRAGNKIAPTFTIGVDCDGETLEDMMHNANDILFQALGRGGDQALVVKSGSTKAYGANNVVNAKSTRVRVRLVANAIKEAMQKADTIFVMGHYDEDFDAIGSAIGVAKLAKTLDKTTAIVVSDSNNTNNSVAKIVDMLNRFWDKSVGDNKAGNEASEGIHYSEIMLKEEEAIKLVTPKSLLVVVDHHRAGLSASKKLVELIPNKIIIDHHRRAEDIMADENTLLYLEPSSSSASELVTELTGYFDNTLEFSAAEATALYSGIVLDTKSFVIQTGERTFEAAALLRRSGAEPNLVKDLFKDDLTAVQRRSQLIANARMPLPGLAISVNRNAEKGEAASVIAAQTADMLVSTTGVSMSVAMTEYTDGSLGLSARSDGTINVQVIMEALGGGGHQTVAGAQLKDKRAREAELAIVELAKKQFDKLNATEGEKEQ